MQWIVGNAVSDGIRSLVDIGERDMAVEQPATLHTSSIDDALPRE